MPTFTALTLLNDRDHAHALGEAMEDMDPEPTGVGVFEMEDGSGLWEVGGYFEAEPDGTELALLAAAFHARPFTVSELPETDWVAHVRRELSPVVAGRFWLYGSHDADTVPEGVEPLLIEASMAFGTGHHGTTVGCLRAFDRMLTAGATPVAVADIGCGTAVLAMAAARVWPDPATGAILASDIDPVAVDVARVNLECNGLAGRVICLEATGLDHPQLAANMPYGIIFANILKGPLIDLAPAIAAALAPQGTAILSGLLVDQANDVADAFAATGLIVRHKEEIGDWATLCVVKT